MTKNKMTSQAARLMGRCKSKRKRKSCRKNLELARQRLKFIYDAGRLALEAPPK